MTRYDKLVDKVVEGATNAIEKFDIDQFDHLVRHAGVPSRRFRDELVKHVQSKTRRDAIAELESLQVPQNLAEIEDAERRAWNRRARLASAPEHASPFDMPVNIATLTTEELIDCQLAAPREQWLKELDSWDSGTKKQLDQLAQQLEDRKNVMRNKIIEFESKLAKLKEVETTLTIR